MFTKMIETLKKKDKKEEAPLRIYGEGRFKENFFNFIEFLIKYLDIDVLTKKFDECDKIVSKEFMFYSHFEELNYLIYILKEIKNFIPLIFKLSQDFWLVDKLEKSNLKDDSIIKILENFVSLERTGRKKLFNKYDQEHFREIKKKYRNIIAFIEETEKWDGKTKGSILDYAKAIKEHNISKRSLLEAEGDFRYYRDRTNEWSKRTKYRFDKDVFKIEELIFPVRDIYDNYDFYMKILKDNEKEKNGNINKA